MIRRIPSNISGESAAWIVRRSDERFENRISDVVGFIIARGPGIRAVTLCGPTCSGKTTASSMLASEFERRGRRAHIISIDDYYFDRNVLIGRSLGAGPDGGDGKIDFDSPDTIDIEALTATVSEIFEQKCGRVEYPNYDFLDGTRKGSNVIETDGSDIFIFEGIQALYPQVSALFAAFPTVSLFINVRGSLQIGHRIFNRNRIRLLRRLVRDYYRRSATAAETLSLWESVRENEDANIYPYTGKVDYYLDSLMDYDVVMLKPYLEKILAEVPEDSGYALEAGAILETLRGLPVIDSSLIGEKSLYHEFV